MSRFPLRALLPALAALLGACSTSDAGKASATPATSANATATAGGDVAAQLADSTSVLARADKSRIQGDPKASVWLVVVSDFQCPYCKTWHDETYQALVNEYVKTGKVRMAYVHLPLRIHPHAVPTAEASLCAGLQGKFWQMQDALFEGQARWSKVPPGPRAYDAEASKVGVNNVAYAACMAKGTTRPLVQADYERISRAGVQSTPTFIIGNEGISGAQPIGVFREVLDRAIANASGANATGAKQPGQR